MPKEIWLTIVWDEMSISMSSYTVTRMELEEMVDNYNYQGQLHFFTYVPMEIMRQWLWDVYAREPYEIIVEKTFY